MLNFINSLRQELSGAAAYQGKSRVSCLLHELPQKFSVGVKNRGKDNFQCISYLSITKYRIKRLIANSSSCTITEFSKLLNYCLTAVKSQVL